MLVVGLVSKAEVVDDDVGASIREIEDGIGCRVPAGVPRGKDDLGPRRDPVHQLCHRPALVRARLRIIEHADRRGVAARVAVSGKEAGGDVFLGRRDVGEARVRVGNDADGDASAVHAIDLASEVGAVRSVGFDGEVAAGCSVRGHRHATRGADRGGSAETA